MRLKLNAAIISLLIISTVPFFIIAFAGNKSENKDDNIIIDTEVSDTTGYEFGIAHIGATGQPEVIYDKDTKVMYLVSENGNHTVILNSDGTPRLYEEDK